MQADLGHAVVTGSSSGIGRSIAIALLAAGWSVTGIDIQKPAWSHPQLRPLVLDLTDAGALEQSAAALSNVRAIVHAAGVLRLDPLGQLQRKDGELMWRIHVDAATRLVNTLYPQLLTAGNGRVVLVGSRASQGIPGRSQYAASKAALLGLARSWAAELAPQGVTVNVVSPAATQTAMVDDPLRSGTPPRVPPIGRLIKPEEIAALVAFLLSPMAAAITGQDIAICGGASLVR